MRRVNIDHEKHNEILCRWQEGWPATRIAKHVGLSRNRVSLVVCKARERNDPRAIQHVNGRGEIIGRDWSRKYSRQSQRSPEYQRHLEAGV